MTEAISYSSYKNDIPQGADATYNEWIFEQYLVMKKKSEKTRTTYLRNIRTGLKSCEEIFGSLENTLADSYSVDRVVENLTEKGRAKSTIRSIVSPLVQFFNCKREYNGMEPFYYHYLDSAPKVIPRKERVDYRLKDFEDYLVSFGYSPNSIHTYCKDLYHLACGLSDLNEPDYSVLNENSVNEYESRYLNSSHSRLKNFNVTLKHWLDFCSNSGRQSLRGRTVPRCQNPFADRMHGYRFWLEEKGYSGRTVRQYVDYAGRILAAMSLKKELRSPTDITEEDLLSAKNYLEQLTDVTAKSYMCALGLFLEFTTHKNPVKNDYAAIRHVSRIDKDRPESIRFREALSAYRDELAERGFHKDTVIANCRIVWKLYEMLAENVGYFTPEEIDFHHIRNLAKIMKDEGRLRQVTVRDHLAQLGLFLEFTCGTNPYRRAKLLWTNEPIERQFIDPKDWLLMCKKATIQERMILVLGAGLGMRRKEIAEVKVSWFQRDGKIKIEGKGRGFFGKTCLLRIPNVVKNTLDEYLVRREEILDEYGDRSEGRLLVSEEGLKGTPLTPDEVSWIVQRCSDRTGCKITCHVLRRLYCTMMMDDGIDCDTIRRRMRHASFDTTAKCYMEAREDRMDEAAGSVDRFLAAN